MKNPSEDCPTAYRFPMAAMAAIAACGQALGQAAAADDGLEALQSAEAALVALIRQAEPSVVAVTHNAPRVSRQSPLNPAGRRLFFEDLRNLPTRRANAEPSGAGVLIDPGGLILTQYLVVEPGRQHSITTVDGVTHAAEIRAADPRSGLAVLAILNPAAPFPALRTGKAEDLRKGSTVVTIGNPFAIAGDGQPTACRGAITNTARKAGDQVNLNNARDERHGNYRTTLHHHGSLIQSDARLGWNASGGALINLRGELVGITTTASTIAGHENPAGYAIPLNEAFRRIVRTLSEGKEVEYGLLGISFSIDSTVTTPGGLVGIAVDAAVPAGPAGKAGIRPRDVITDVGGRPTRNADQLQLLIGQEPPGKPVEVGFHRDGEQRRVSVRLAKAYIRGQSVFTTPTRRWRGIRVDYATALPQTVLENATRSGLLDPLGCVAVTEVAPESVSFKSGVREGQFISHVGDKRVTTPEEFWSAVEHGDAAINLRFTGRTTEPGQSGVRNKPAEEE